MTDVSRVNAPVKAIINRSSTTRQIRNIHLLTFIPSLGAETQQDEDEQGEQQRRHHHYIRLIQVAVQLIRYENLQKYTSAIKVIAAISHRLRVRTNKKQNLHLLGK